MTTKILATTRSCSKVALALTIMGSLFACAPAKEETAADGSTTDGGQTAAELAGSGVSCAVFSGAGDALDGLGYTRALTLNADGTYTYSIYFSDNLGCTTSSASGGNNFATYYQAGVYTLSGGAGTPSTATRITFTVGSGTMIIRASDAADGAALATWINANCTANPAFSTTADSTKSFSGQTCVGDSDYNFASPPAVSATEQNIGYNDGTTFQAGAISNLWTPGAGGFPSSYSDTFYSW